MAVAQDKRISELTAPTTIADTDVLGGYRPGTGGEPNLDIKMTAGLLRSIDAEAIFAGSQSRTLASKAADRDSILDIIPAPYHTAIKARTSTVEVRPYFDAALLATTALFVPRGRYYLKDPINYVSGRRMYGIGQGSELYNDRSDTTDSKWACISLGDHHKTGFPYYSAFNCDAATIGDPALTVTNGITTGLSVGQYVHVSTPYGSGSGDIPSYGYVSRITSIASAVITLADAPERAMPNPVIYTVAGTDNDLDVPWSIIHDVEIEGLGFTGRTPFATKGAVYNIVARNLWAIDCHHLLALNSVNHGLFENIFGDYGGRKVELALNSRDVVVRNVPGRLAPLANGEARTVPIHITEQATNIVLDRVPVDLPASFTSTYRVAELKGFNILVNKCDWHHGGTSNQEVLAVPNLAFTGYPAQDITLRDCNLSCGSGKSRLVDIGGSATNAPIRVQFKGGTLRGPVTSESVWCRHGSGHAFDVDDYCDKGLKPATTAQYPDTTGYRRR